MTLKTNAFATLALAPATLANLEQLGYLEMTPIQAASLPVALAGTDLIAQAKTGSGKTAAFALALLAKLNPRWFSVQAMVMCPTRELADQVKVENSPLGAGPRQHQGGDLVRWYRFARPTRFARERGTHCGGNPRAHHGPSGARLLGARWLKYIGARRSRSDVGHGIF